MNTLVVYTAIFGRYDKLIEPVVSSKDIDYICFTDSTDFVSNIWQIKVVEPYFKDDMIRSARYYKVCPHHVLEQYKYSLWIDGNMRLRLVPDIKALLNGSGIAMERHRKRKCLYEEARVCKELKLDNPEVIDNQISIYEKWMPKGAGLFASYMVAREHNDEEIIPKSDAWWSNICMHSRRDQISLPVAFVDYPIGSIPTETRRRLVTRMKHKYGKY